MLTPSLNASRKTKMTPLGQLPVDWGFHKLVEVCDQKSGLRTGPFGSQLHAYEYEANGVPVIMPKDIWSGRIFDASIARISQERADELKQHRCITGDIIIARRGDIGRCGLVTKKEEGWITGTGCLRVRPSLNKCLPSYLIQFLMLPQVTQLLTASAVGQTMLNLNSAALSSLPVAVPPVSEQLEITAILGSWDQATERLEKLIVAKRQLKHGLMQQLLTGKKRFREFVSDPRTRVTRHGAVPNDWEYLPIGGIAKEVYELNRQGKPLPVLSCTKHQGLVDSLQFFGKQIFSKDLSTYKIVRRGQYAYATNHIEEGSIGFQDAHDAALISPMYTVFQTCDKVDDPFLFRLLKTEHYRRIFQENMSGTIDRRGSLRWRQFASIRVALPSLPEQRSIAAVLESHDKEIVILQKEAAAVREQKKGLMQKLLTGKMRVTNLLTESM